MSLDPTVSEWLNLFARWFHVFAGILWIGSTYYFTWLDGQFTETKDESAAQVWMVHSGGFYVVEKRKSLSVLPRDLHWFRWEAALTWLSGAFLLTLMFYLGGGGGLVDRDVLDISGVTALAIGIGTIVCGLLLYELMWWSIFPFILKKQSGRLEIEFALVAYVLIVCLALILTHLLSGRAAYIHIGAMFGTIMAANVWLHILPAQRKMIAAIEKGEKPDARLAAQAKMRSKQNTFTIVPVVFLMISNHYAAATYGNNYNWLILSLLILVGWGAAKIIRRA